MTAMERSVSGPIQWRGCYRLELSCLRWMDFDNDGMKDLFVSNGIPKRMNDRDFINYIGNEEIQNKLRTNKEP